MFLINTNAVKYSDKVIPNYKQVPSGSAVTFKCLSYKEVSWKFNNGEWPHMMNIGMKKGIFSKLNSYWMKLQDVRELHSGIYTCYGVDSNNTFFYNDATLKVTCKLEFKSF